MTLPASGLISLADVAVELGRASTAATSLDEAAVRALAGVPSGAISLSNLYGKSSVSYQAISGTADNSLTGGGLNSLTLTVRRAGTWQLTGSLGSQTLSPSGSTNWLTPTAANAGDTRWVRLTVAAGAAPSSGSAVGSWIALTSDVSWTRNCPPASSTSAQYTVQISADSGGSTILSTGTVYFTLDND